MNTKRNKGFSLIELAVALTVIGLLSTFAVPAYTSYVKKSRRADAQGALTSLANAMERYHSINNTYVGASLGVGGIYPAEAPIDGDTKYYDLSINATTVTGYTLYGTPKNGQAGDGRLSLDSTGNRLWNTKDDGTGSDTSW